MADGVFGAETAGGVGQDRGALPVEGVEDGAPLAVAQPFAPDRNGGYLTPAGGKAIAHQFKAGILAGAGDQPAAKGESADHQWFIGRRLRVGRTTADESNDFHRIVVLQNVVRLVK